MKRILLTVLSAAICLSAAAQKTQWHDASDLTIIGKAIPTSKSFSRIDTSVYKFNNRTIDIYANYSTGLAVLFETDSRTIKAKWTTGGGNAGDNMTPIVQKGLDLYIMKDGKWTYAGVGRLNMRKAPYSDHQSTIITKMAEGTKQCLLYLPLFDKVDALEIGIDEETSIKAIANPFRHTIVVHGSSITHGASASRAGLTYSARLGRELGLYTINLGFSGQCKLQKEYAEYLADIKEVDAFVFDTFSNPSAEVIQENFDNFVDIVRTAHPDVPMIFLQTERRESRNFNTAIDSSETKKQQMAESVVKERMKSDKHIYFIDSEDFLGHDHEGTVDGSHPTDLGFTRMLDVITPKIRKIFKKYGIR